MRGGKPTYGIPFMLLLYQQSKTTYQMCFSTYVTRPLQDIIQACDIYDSNLGTASRKAYHLTSIVSPIIKIRRFQGRFHLCHETSPGHHSSMRYLWFQPGDRLKKSIPSYQYSESHYKDKTFLRPFYLYNGKPYTWKDRLYIETRPWYFTRRGWYLSHNMISLSIHKLHISVELP